MNLTIAKERYYNLINKIVNFNKVSHAYMIEINDYDNDFNCIIDFVKLILSKNSDDNSISKLIDSGNYPDLKIIEPEGNMIKKKQLMQLQEDFRNKSFLDNKMVYIIKQVDKLNESSGNTILKFLEEPEEDIIAILVTTNRYKVIDTVLSRCQILSLQGSDDSYSISENIVELIKFMIQRDSLFVNYQYIFDNILSDKVVAKDVLSIVEKIFVNYLNYISGVEGFSCNDDVIRILSQVNVDLITKFIAVIEEEVSKLEFNVNYKLWLDCFFARLIGG